MKNIIVVMNEFISGMRAMNIALEAFLAKYPEAITATGHQDEILIIGSIRFIPRVNMKSLGPNNVHGVVYIHSNCPRDVQGTLNYAQYLHLKTDCPRYVKRYDQGNCEKFICDAWKFF